MTKILMFAGSARADSVNKKLVFAAANIAREVGAEVTIVDLAAYEMPIYQGDDEEKNGVPENAKKLHDLVQANDTIVIASPEYNGLPSPLLKNVIDWVSRVDVKVYEGKVAGLLAASPGGLGGMRGLPHLRTLLTNLNTLVVPQQAAIGGAFDAFDDSGMLKDKKQHAMVKGVIDAVLKCTS